MAVIILVGFMGCGKSTLGRTLAKHLKYSFLDADEAIESEQQLKIPAIFEQYGEDHFRKIETQFIQKLHLKTNVVLATGGGMPCFGENMQLLNQVGITFYLQRSIPELVHRLSNAKKPRPLIHGKNKEELTQYVAEILPKRETYYLQSNFVLDRTQQNAMFIQFLLNQL
jgi:shikimate kinase